jgi:hypothetical protein
MSKALPVLLPKGLSLYVTDWLVQPTNHPHGLATKAPYLLEQAAGGASSI